MPVPSLAPRLCLLVGAAIGAVTLCAGPARAQGPATDADGGAPEAGASAEELTPPSLATQVDADYPADALKERREGAVGLSLSIDEEGRVVDARVSTPSGYADFDAAALAAARRFTFVPAKRGGAPIRATVQFTYEFHLPPEAAPPPPPPPPPPAPPKPAAEITQEGDSSLVLARRPISAASSMSVRDREFRLRPVASVADILRVTPGLLVVQHAGGGKANQYFLRGFDADHGTDIALSVDGIPINMVSHAHGQGYADSNFLIPEIIERVEITKGPYFAEQGDFSTAGSVNLVTRDSFEHSSLGFGYGGSPGNGGPMYRGLLVASPKMESIKPLFVAEIGRANGPFHNPEKFDRYKLFSKVSFAPSPGSTVSIGASSYAGDWYSSGQIPRRAVEAGMLDRFSTHDPSEGGSSSRHQLFAAYKLRPSAKSELSAMGYVAQYRLDLLSNFTINLVDPDNGDQIRQRDRRVFAGGKVSYRTIEHVGGLGFDTQIGANFRTDAIDNGLERTRQRQFLSRVVGNGIGETTVGAFAKEDVTITKWLRVVGGARADMFSFTVDDQTEAAGGGVSGTKAASQLSPKGALVLSPIRQKNVELDVYGNYGHGFHSNDARGVVRTRDAVTPLTRAIGYEGGARARFFDRWDLAAAVWRLNLESETVWIGDEGTTEAGDATKRYGIELETRFEITKWLSADLDVTATKSAFVANRGNGDAVALAPRRTWAGGLSARHPNGVRGGFRFYGVGDRPATEDEFIVAEGFTVADVHLGYQTRRFDVGLDVENLFNARYKAAQFASTSRLRTEPPTNAPAPAGTCGNGSRVVTGDGGNFGGCEDNHFTSGYPFTARITTTFYLD
ncbi:MAG: TonB-dependent receptor [Myxococcales bacterium]|nr:TonB-dependent receptor [Myxococcales bacterium]